MIVDPPQNYNYNANSHINSLAQNVNQSMTRAAIILDREAKDIAPIATLALPTVALVTFYGKNEAFLPSASDKFLKRTLKQVGQKTTDVVSSTIGRGLKYSEGALNKASVWTKHNVKETAGELKTIFGGKFSGLCRALRDDARDVVKVLLKR